MPEVSRFRQSKKMKHELDVSRTELEKAIDEWIFSERDRMILRRRLLDGVCFEPLAAEFDLSVRHTKSIVYKCEEKLFKHMKGD